MRRELVLPVLLLAAVVASARADEVTPPLPNLSPPLILRLDGVLVSDRKAARGVGFTAVSLGFRGDDVGQQRWLAVTDARTVGGDHPLLGKDVLDEVAPFTPNLYIAGPAELAERLRDLPAGTAVRVEGLVRRGSRTYLLRSVEVHEPREDR